MADRGAHHAALAQTLHERRLGVVAYDVRERERQLLHRLVGRAVE